MPYFQTLLDFCCALSPRPRGQLDFPSLRYPAWEKEEKLKEKRGFTVGKIVCYITVRSRDDGDDIMIFLLKSMHGAEEHVSPYYRNKCKYASKNEKKNVELGKIVL